MNLLLLLACAPVSKPATTPDTAAATDTPTADSDSAVETASDTPTDTTDSSPMDTVDTDTALPPHEGPFHPELSSYPRIVALPGDKDTILARIAGTTGDANAIAQWQSLYAG